MSDEKDQREKITSEYPADSIGKKLTKTAVDLATIGLSVTFTAAACRTGSIEGGIAAAVVSLPFVYSMIGIMSRHILPGTELSCEFSNRTGLQITGNALKNIFTNAKVAMIATGVMGFIGITFGVVNADFRARANERQKYEHMMAKLPVLPADTILNIRPSDLCVRHDGRKISNGYEMPYNYNGSQYKIICK